MITPTMKIKSGSDLNEIGLKIQHGLVTLNEINDLAQWAMNVGPYLDELENVTQAYGCGDVTIFKVVEEVIRFLQKSGVDL